MSSKCSHNMVNFGLLAAEIGWRVWVPLQISTGFASWQRYCTASSSGRQPNFATLNRGHHLYLAGWPSHWALAHISSFYYLYANAMDCHCWIARQMPNAHHSCSTLTSANRHTLAEGMIHRWGYLQEGRHFNLIPDAYLKMVCYQTMDWSHTISEMHSTE